MSKKSRIENWINNSQLQKFVDEYCENEFKKATLRRIRVPGFFGDGGVYHEGYTYYETRDGRFQVKREWTLYGDWWSAYATDGSKPFNYCGAKVQSFTASTLAECREEIAMVIEDEYLAEQNNADWYGEGK